MFLRGAGVLHRPELFRGGEMTSPLMATYDRLDVAFERGEGARLYASDGRRYLDFGAGIAVIGVGHCHPQLVEALRRQAGLLWHCSNLYRIPGQERLAARLAERCFADQVFFCNSGAEANECALKLIRKHHDATGSPGRWRVIAFEDAFHGRTLATLAAGGSVKHLAGFAPVVDGFDRARIDDIDSVRAAITDETAAVLVEPIQGEGGVRMLSPEFLRQLRALTEEHGLLLCFDEVQCGLGRTGRLFAHQWTDIAPDIMTLAKGLGGGFPIGACLATAAVAAAFTPGSHGSTFGGNPLAMTAGNAVLDIVLTDGFLARVRSIGALMHQRLARLPGLFPDVISEVRGLGLMLGLKCAVPNGQVVDRLFAHGLLAVPAGDNVVRLLPPLTISSEEIDEGVAVIERSCAELAEKAA
jgi:acetylornithine/N-succinyldiaminopimelate aminotransferase